MLALARTEGTKVVILIGGLKIEVQVTKIKGSQVQLGFSGIKEVKFHREEVLDEIRRDNPEDLLITNAEYLKITSQVIRGLKPQRRRKKSSRQKS
ncbi:MAG: carbon storage regulator [Deltaproteobacteria bacterium]|nr:carbon storage regulator [Deltaproteobacteria bacterium]